MTCGRCGTENPEGASFCPACGAQMAPAVRDEFRLVFVHHDGTDGTSYLLRGDQIDIGRTEGDLLFDDPYLAPRHARVAAGVGGQVLSDLGSRNGVYVRLRAGAELNDGDHILIGKQVLLFELVPDFENSLRPALQNNMVLFGSHGTPAWGRLRQMGPTGVAHDVFHFTSNQVVLGREQADVVFTTDQFMSRRHARISRQPGAGGARPAVQLEDLGSSNGTFIKMRADHFLVAGDMIRMGDVLLRFEQT